MISPVYWIQLSILYKFLDRNVSILLVAGFRHVHLLATIFPEVLEVHSNVLLEAQIHNRNILAITTKTGNICWLFFHQRNGLLLISSWGFWRYLSSSQEMSFVLKLEFSFPEDKAFLVCFYLIIETISSS